MITIVLYKSLYKSYNYYYINGKYLNRLRFVNDIVLLTMGPANTEINNKKNFEIGLKMNFKKTDVMLNRLVDLEKSNSSRYDPSSKFLSYLHYGQLIILGTPTKRLK